MIIKTECRECRGTGLYHGVAEPEGVAVICVCCRGTGCAVIEYTPFVERKQRDDIQTVRLSRARFIGLCSSMGDSVTYDEFMSGNIPSI